MTIFNSLPFEISGHFSFVDWFNVFYMCVRVWNSPKNGLRIPKWISTNSDKAKLYLLHWKNGEIYLLVMHVLSRSNRLLFRSSYKSERSTSLIPNTCTNNDLDKLLTNNDWKALALSTLTIVIVSVFGAQLMIPYKMTIFNGKSPWTFSFFRYRKVSFSFVEQWHIFLPISSCFVQFETKNLRVNQ